MFSSEYGQELASCLKTLFSHTAGSSSVGVQPAAFRSTVSSGSLGKGRSCQYFVIKLGSFNGRPKPVEHFFERAGVQIGFFFIVTGTGPRTILAGFFSEVKFKARFLFFPHIGCSLISSKIIVGKVHVSLISSRSRIFGGARTSARIFSETWSVWIKIEPLFYFVATILL